MWVTCGPATSTGPLRAAGFGRIFWHRLIYRLPAPRGQGSSVVAPFATPLARAGVHPYLFSTSCPKTFRAEALRTPGKDHPIPLAFTPLVHRTKPRSRLLARATATTARCLCCVGSGPIVAQFLQVVRGALPRERLWRGVKGRRRVGACAWLWGVRGPVATALQDIQTHHSVLFGLQLFSQGVRRFVISQPFANPL